MPVGEEFLNPYRILKRPGAGPVRVPNRDDLRSLKGWSGVFHCSLTAFTPLELKGVSRRQDQTVRFSQTPVIPGTSLKGMVRSVAEFVGRGCCSIGETATDGTWGKCRSGAVCVTCAMFGMQHGGRALRGRVRCDDATRVHAGPLQGTFWLYSGSPKTTHSAFYSTADGQKFYHHQPTSVVPRTVPATRPNAFQVFPVRVGSTFSFDVRFEGLTDSELALLHYAVQLEDGMLHHLGRGKPQGMGSVQVKVSSMEVFDAAGFYRGRTKPLDALPAAVAAARIAIEKDASPEMEDFRRMMWWRPADSNVYSYPSHEWFRTPGNSAKPLRSVGDVIPTPFVPGAVSCPVAPVAGDDEPLEATSAINTFANCTLFLRDRGKPIIAAQHQGKDVGVAIAADALELKAKYLADAWEHFRQTGRLNVQSVSVEEIGNLHRIKKIVLS